MLRPFLTIRAVGPGETLPPPLLLLNVLQLQLLLQLLLLLLHYLVKAIFGCTTLEGE